MGGFRQREAVTSLAGERVSAVPNVSTAVRRQVPGTSIPIHAIASIVSRLTRKRTGPHAAELRGAPSTAPPAASRVETLAPWPGGGTTAAEVLRKSLSNRGAGCAAQLAATRRPRARPGLGPPHPADGATPAIARRAGPVDRRIARSVRVPDKAGPPRAADRRVARGTAAAAVRGRPFASARAGRSTASGASRALFARCAGPPGCNKVVVRTRRPG